MNKILVDREDILVIDNEQVLLDIGVKKCTLKIKGDVILQEFYKKEEYVLDLEIIMDEGSSLVFNRLANVERLDERIVVKQGNNSRFNLNYSLLVSDSSRLVIDNEILGNNNYSDISVKSVTTLKGNLAVEGLVKANLKTVDNNLVEKIKMLSLNDEISKCMPNLVVKSDEVIVNHAATISGIGNDELFYLMSRGIGKEAAILLLKSGFLLENLVVSDDVLSEFRKII